MYINKVISFKNAWNRIISQNSTEIFEAMQSIEELVSEDLKSKIEARRVRPRDAWRDILDKKGWNTLDSYQDLANGKSIKVSRVGSTKNGLSVTYPFEDYDQLNRWLFQQSALAVKHGLVEVPIMLSAMSDYSLDKSDWMRGESFETHLRQLDLLAPLSHPFPFRKGVRALFPG